MLFYRPVIVNCVNRETLKRFSLWAKARAFSSGSGERILFTMGVIKMKNLFIGLFFAVSFGSYAAAFSFKEIVAGQFTMGSPLSEIGRFSDEGPVDVTISKSFEIMTKEITQSQWFDVMGDNPSYFKEKKYCDDHQVINGVELCPNNPVEEVSWSDVQQYIKKLNDGISGCHGTPQDASGCYRLPTEAEWEFAARGGTGTTSAHSFNDGIIDDYAWHTGNSDGQTHSVGSRGKNPYDLYDMHGNVWEWVQDRYRKTLPGGTDPLHVSSGSFRIFRGGGWLYGVLGLRSADRNYDGPGFRFDHVGFRLVRTL